MNQDWLEMKLIRRRDLNKDVWIPLRADRFIERNGRAGFLGFKEEYFGVGTLAIPIDARELTNEIDWVELGNRRNHRPRVEESYVRSDTYMLEKHGTEAIHLVLDQRLNRAEIDEWHLNQDVVLGLSLKREGDTWLAANEGYVEVARLKRRDDGSPTLLEIRSEHLKDYLCARKMALYVTSYRQRQLVVENRDFLAWKDETIIEEVNKDRWEGRVQEIHEGGYPFGGTRFIMRMFRNDVDTDEDVPALGFPTDENISSESWNEDFRGRRLLRIMGELWRCEWVEPGAHSPRVAGDDTPRTICFVVDAAGTRKPASDLIDSGSWLWFRPEVMTELINRRGGGCEWYTRDTGKAWCSPDDGVFFGVNQLGLINVYAKDISLLPKWQQEVWSGHNVSPEGGVSEELLMAQVKCLPAETQAPEECLGRILETFGQVTKERLGAIILRPHNDLSIILHRCHRFRALDRHGLFALAKDLARLTADSIDAAELQKHFPLAKGERLGSLKSLERLLGSKTEPNTAHELMGPLAGIYELRLADAHLSGSNIKDSLALVGIDESAPLVHQGYQLLNACVTSLFEITNLVKENW